MTDKQIVKGLECCTSEEFRCRECPYDEINRSDSEYDCVWYMHKDAVDCIRRHKEKIGSLEKIQQINSSAYYKLQCYNTELQAEIDKKNELLEYVKAESECIENLVVENRKTTLEIYDAYEREVKTARAEAIKEFASRLKANRPHLNTGEQVFYIRPEAVDELVKELAGESNETD